MKIKIIYIFGLLLFVSCQSQSVIEDPVATTTESSGVGNGSFDLLVRTANSSTACSLSGLGVIENDGSDPDVIFKISDKNANEEMIIRKLTYPGDSRDSLKMTHAIAISRHMSLNWLEIVGDGFQGHTARSATNPIESWHILALNKFKPIFLEVYTRSHDGRLAKIIEQMSCKADSLLDK